ncbi:MAG: DUF6751 family protein [Oscillospiraceae bacterium]
MRYPRWWNDSITVYHKQETKDINQKTQTAWVKNTQSGCFFGQTTQQVMGDKTIFKENRFIVRCPSPIYIGDIIVKGIVDDIIPHNISGAELLNKYPDTAFTVNTVKDNTKMRNAHYHGEGV